MLSYRHILTVNLFVFYFYMLYLSTIISVTEIIIVIVPVMLIIAFITAAEIKTMTSMQRRLSPNIVGYHGLLQAFLDALKLILKEYALLTQANIGLFFLGPVITLIFSLLGYAVVPYGPGLAIWDFNLGVVYVLAVFSLATYGILLACWSANSKYAFLGSLKGREQLTNYELILSSAMLLVVLLIVTLSLFIGIDGQRSSSLIMLLIPVIIILFIGSITECNKGPFETPEVLGLDNPTKVNLLIGTPVLSGINFEALLITLLFGCLLCSQGAASNDLTEPSLSVIESYTITECLTHLPESYWHYPISIPLDNGTVLIKNININSCFSYSDYLFLETQNSIDLLNSALNNGTFSFNNDSNLVEWLKGINPFLRGALLVFGWSVPWFICSKVVVPFASPIYLDLQNYLVQILIHANYMDASHWFTFHNPVIDLTLGLTLNGLMWLIVSYGDFLARVWGGVYAGGVGGALTISLTLDL